MLATISTPDTIVLVLMALFALRGVFRGFVWQALRTGGLIGGLLLAVRYGEPVGKFLSERFAFVPTAGSDIVGWLVVVIGTFLAVTLVAHLVRNAIHQTRLTSLDRALGAALGAALGLGIAAIGFTVWASWKTDAETREVLRNSTSTVYMAKFIETVTPLFPEGVRTRWGPVLHSLDGN